jgi:hypothetical protein
MRCHPVVVDALPCARGIHRQLAEKGQTHRLHQLVGEAGAADQNQHAARQDNHRLVPAAARNQAYPEADQTLVVAGEGQNHPIAEEALEAAQIQEALAADQSPAMVAARNQKVQVADQIQGAQVAGQIQARAEDQIHPREDPAEARRLVAAAVVQTLKVHLEADQTLKAHLEADQTLKAHLEADQTLAARQILAVQVADQTPEVPVADQTPAVPAAVQTPEVPAVCQKQAAEEEPRIREAPQARQAERHKSHRTCRRASLVRRNEGSSWSPSRDDGPTPRPPRR